MVLHHRTNKHSLLKELSSEHPLEVVKLDAPMENVTIDTIRSVIESEFAGSLPRERMKTSGDKMYAEVCLGSATINGTHIEIAVKCIGGSMIDVPVVGGPLYCSDELKAKDLHVFIQSLNGNLKHISHLLGIVTDCNDVLCALIMEKEDVENRSLAELTRDPEFDQQRAQTELQAVLESWYDAGYRMYDPSKDNMVLLHTGDWILVDAGSLVPLEENDGDKTDIISHRLNGWFEALDK